MIKAAILCKLQAYDTDESGISVGLQISLFDISDRANMTIIQSYDMIHVDAVGVELVSNNITKYDVESARYIANTVLNCSNTIL